MHAPGPVGRPAGVDDRNRTGSPALAVKIGVWGSPLTSVLETAGARSTCRGDRSYRPGEALGSSARSCS